MRFVVFGTGAIGGVIGARLVQGGLDVVFIARSGYSVLKERGLRVESPAGAETVSVSVARRPEEIDWNPDDVVLLTVKTQDSSKALNDLAAVASADLRVVCVQNAVENERLAFQLFKHVYGVCVMCPASYLEPGVVQAWSARTNAILDIGRYPEGVDSVAHSIAKAFEASGLESVPRPDIMRWKYRKLLLNLGNAVEAICGPQERGGPIVKRARQEGIACLDAAGISYVSEEEDLERRGDRLQLGPIAGRTRAGGSSWQSLVRRARTIETDYLNGEIVRLGQKYGVATPVNSLLQTLANQFAREGRAPGTMSADELLALLASAK